MEGRRGGGFTGSQGAAEGAAEWTHGQGEGDRGRLEKELVR